MTAVPRIACEVPHCGCSRRGPPEVVWLYHHSASYDRWICRRHWTAVPAPWRQLHAAARKRVYARRDHRSWRLAAFIFARCRRLAIERAGGIA